MADVCYDVCKAEQIITNTKDVCQGAESPRRTPSFGAVCETCVVTYHEGNALAGGPSLTNKFEVICDDLVKKY